MVGVSAGPEMAAVGFEPAGKAVATGVMAGVAPVAPVTIPKVMVGFPPDR